MFPKTRTEWLIGGGLLAVLVVMAAWWWFGGGDRKQQLITQLKAEIERINEKDTSDLRDGFSPEFKAFLKSKGMQDDRQFTLLVRSDLARGAQYSYNRMLFWDEENEDFAEVEFERKQGKRRQQFHMPFFYRNGRWWVAGAFRTPERCWMPEKLRGMENYLNLTR